mgnify:CR=1 FL=1
MIRQARQAADGYLKSGRAWNRKLERLDRFRGHLGGGWSGGRLAGLVCRDVPAIRNLPNFLRET